MALVHTMNVCLHFKHRRKSVNRLRWSKELHDLFLKALEDLGDQATPITIARVMNVPGITKDHVSSHLQRYRHYSTSKVKKIRPDFLCKPFRPESSLNEFFQSWSMATTFSHTKPQVTRYQPTSPSFSTSSSYESVLRFCPITPDTSSITTASTSSVSFHREDCSSRILAQTQIEPLGTEATDHSWYRGPLDSTCGPTENSTLRTEFCPLHLPGAESPQF
jgi:SHAQKYF class myb-like DNA-binding protein